MTRAAPPAWLISPPTAVALSASARDEEILNLVSSWEATLAGKDYKLAYGMTLHNQHRQWSPEVMRRVIEYCDSFEPHPRGPFKVTVPLPDNTFNLRREVLRDEAISDASIIGSVWYDLVLNDWLVVLTATFEILSLGDRQALCLDQLHAM